MTFRDDRWRDSYDAWKLATPPEYEEEPSDESLFEESMWRDGVSREESDQIMAAYRRRKIMDKARARHERRHNRRRRAKPEPIVDEVPF